MSEATVRGCLRAALLLVLVSLPATAAGETASAERESAWLGVWLTDALDGGVEVVAVVPQGPAQRAGVRSGDLILEVDATAITDQQSLGALLAERRPGERVSLSLLRSGDAVQIAVTLGRRSPEPLPYVPDAPLPAQPLPPLSTAPADRLQSVWSDLLYGLRVAEITPALREHYGAPPEWGVLVLGVGGEEAGAFANLEVGDVLVRIGEQGIRSRRELERTLSTWRWQRPLEASVVRAGDPRVITISQPAPIAQPLSPPREREILERRIRLEIERLQRRVRELEKQLEALAADD